MLVANFEEFVAIYAEIERLFIGSIRVFYTVKRKIYSGHKKLFIDFNITG
jgi:hypothetical protein